MNHSESLNEFAAALAKAQAQIKGAPKDSDNPHFRSRFASLASVWDACRTPLTDNGLSVLQMPYAEGNAVTVTTMVLHTSGQWVSEPLTMTAKDASPQSVGSALTYARRYGLQAAVGICPEDDDGNAASQPGGEVHEAYRPQPARQQAPAPQRQPSNGNGNGNGNGHHGHDQPRQHDGSRPPSSGRGLFAWVKEQEQRFNYPSLLKEVNAWSKRMGYPGKMTEFDAGQVAEAHRAALAIIRVNFSEDEAAALSGAGREPGQEG